jgi:hypothetical protein
MLMTINRGKFLQTVGWTTVVLGLYLVGVGIRYNGESEHIKPRKTGDNVIDAEFTIIE